MNTQHNKTAAVKAGRASVDGKFIAIGPAGEKQGAPYSLMCLQAKLGRSDQPTLIFFNASAIESEVAKLEVDNRDTLRIVYMRNAIANIAEEVSLVKRFVPPQKRFRQK
jgi:hypothetical protein